MEANVSTKQRQPGGGVTWAIAFPCPGRLGHCPMLSTLLKIQKKSGKGFKEERINLKTFFLDRATDEASTYEL